MKNKVTTSDVFDINQTTGALILGKNRLDDYATKFLTKYCKQALVTPMPVPVDEIIKEMGLNIQEVCLSDNMDVFGCCLLLDGTVKVYDQVQRKYNSKLFREGTVLIDQCCADTYGEGFKRNTLIHEILHWEKDKTYFNILKLKNKDDSNRICPILCRQSQTYFEPPEGKKTKDNEIRWLEWQAHKLAPRILLPKSSFIKKAKQLIVEKPSCDKLIDDLSIFFLVSRESVKYRLLEVGLKEIINTLEDFEAVYAEIDNNNSFVKLEPFEAFKLIDADNSLREWLAKGRFIFAEGYFVLAEQQFVTIKDGVPKLTSKAKRNLAKCVINICEKKFVTYSGLDKDYIGYLYLKRTDGIDQRLLTFHPKFQADFKYKTDEIYHSFGLILENYDVAEEIELEKMLGDPEKTLCQCLWFLMQKRGWEFPEEFNDKTELHKNYHGKIKKDNYNNMTTPVLMAICIGLKLTLRITEKLFNKSDHKLNYYKNPDMTYIRIMELMPGLSIVEFNDILEQQNIPKLETKSKK